MVQGSPITGTVQRDCRSSHVTSSNGSLASDWIVALKQEGESGRVSLSHVYLRSTPATAESKSLKRNVIKLG